MSTGLPKFVADTVLELSLEYTPMAYLMLSKEGYLKDLGGELSLFGLEHITLNCPIEEQLLFLQGMLPLDKETILFSAVELDSGLYADIHLLQDVKANWIILFDRTKQIHWRGKAQQKSNELSLLRQKLAKMERNLSQSAVPAYLPALDYCNALNMLFLEPDKSGAFKALGAVPLCFQSIYPESFQRCDGLRPDLKFPFIDNFLTDAREVWKSDNQRRKSGPWIEVDSEGKEYALEAIAASWEDRKVLLIEMLDEHYEEHRSFLQMGRENALVRDYLENEVQRRTKDIRAREEEIALRLVWASESRDDGETGAHIRRIGLYSEAMAEAIGWERSKVDEIRIAATMHDIGKISVPDSVLRKPSTLSAEEYQVMKHHTTIGGRILAGSQTGLVRMAKDIAMGHHEWWDGSGYPNGLAGETIPLSARIVAIADVFDALIHERIYKKAMAIEKVITTMEANRGSQFDPDLFDIFLHLQERFQEIASEQSAPLFEGFRGNQIKEAFTRHNHLEPNSANRSAAGSDAPHSAASSQKSSCR